MQLLKVDDLDTARNKIKSKFEHILQRTKTIPVEDSLGFIAAKDIKSPVMIPDFRRSTVDGYAVFAKDTQGASADIPTFLKCVEEVEIGTMPTKSISSGECAYVPTGGMIPEGADGMVMVEYTEEFTKDEIAIHQSVAAGSNIVEIGEDLQKGEIVILQGSQIRSQEIGALYAAGIDTIPVYDTVKIAIISTGDELVDTKNETAKPLPIGKVRDINTYALAGMAQELHGEVVYKSLVKDDENAIKTALIESMNCSDMVLISGGSSKGKKDMTERLIQEIADEGVMVHGLALKPGKPTIVGYDNKTETLFLGLPGHPVAAMLVFRLIFLWLQQEAYAHLKTYHLTAYMDTNLPSAAGRETCILVELFERDGAYIAKPILGKSGLISTLTKAYGYLVIHKNAEGLKEGEQVFVYPL